jgi:hypothetical protein
MTRAALASLLVLAACGNQWSGSSILPYGAVGMTSGPAAIGPWASRAAIAWW